MPPKVAESLDDPAQPAAFRSFWTAKGGAGHTGDMYEYQGPQAHSHAHGAHSHGEGEGGHSHSGGGGESEATPLLHSSDRHSSDRRLFGLFSSYAALCYCLVPVLLLLLLLGWWLYRSYSAPPPLPPIVSTPAGGAIAALCNPFAVVQTAVDLAHHHGLVALLFVLPPSLTSSATSSAYYLQHSALATNATLFFSSVDTPTRLFTRVFEARNLSSGSVVLLPSQFFLLSLHTVLQPPPSFDSSSPVDLALISDDGASLYRGDLSEAVKPPSSALLVDNDGVHTTRLAVSRHPVNLSRSLNLSLHYFQGPPAHIALQLLYRRRDARGKDGKEEAEEVEGEGEEGNELYWHVAEEGSASVPTARYERLMADGWSVVPESWFWLPAAYEGKEDVDRKLAAGVDPCVG